MLKEKNIILWDSPINCGCLPGYESAFYPVLKNNSAKTFSCPFCGKKYEKEDYIIKTFQLNCWNRSDDIHATKVINENNLKHRWVTEKEVLVTTCYAELENLGLSFLKAD